MPTQDSCQTVRAYQKASRKRIRGFLVGVLWITLSCLVSESTPLCQQVETDSESSPTAEKLEQSRHWLLSPTHWNHGLGVSSLAVNLPSQTVAAGGWYGVVSYFNGTTGARTSMAVTGPNGEGNWDLREMEGLTFSGSGNCLAFGIGDTCYIIDLKDPTRVTRLVGHSRPIMAVLLDHDGKTAVTASLDTTIRVWNVESKEEVTRLAQHDDGVLNLCDVDGGKAFASCGYDGKILKWSWTDWKLLGTLALAGSEVRRLAASPDGSLVAYSTTSDTRTVRVLTVATAKLRQAICFDQALSSFCFNGSGDAIVSATNYQIGSELGVQLASTAIADGSATTLEVKLPGGATCMRSYGDQIVCAGSDGALRLADLKTKTVSGCQGSDNAWASGVAFVGGSRFLAGTNAGFCNAVTIATQARAPVAPEAVRTGIPSPLFDAVVSDGRMLAVCGSTSGSARLWEEKGSSVAELATFGTGIVDGACFVEGGKGIVTSNRQGEVHHWKLLVKADGAVVVEHVKQMSQVHQRVGQSWQLKLACGKWHDKDIVITGGLDAKVFVRWLGTQEIIREFAVKSPKLSPNLDRVDGLAFRDATGEVLAVCHGTAYRAKIEGEGAKVAKLELPKDTYVEAVSWSHESTTVFLGLASGAILEWDISKGTEVQRFEAHRVSVTGLAVSDNGKWLVSTSADGGLIVWPLEPRKEK